MKKILIIDDDPSVSLLLRDTFAKHNFHLESANDGEEGLAKIKSSRPDLILLDILMPKINGFEVLDELKTHPDSADIPVIVFSVLEDEKDIETIYTKGAIQYLHKTDYNPNQIVEIISNILHS